MTTITKMTDEDLSVCVVLPASGTGERFGADPPKQYSALLGKPLIMHTINIFQRLSWVKHIILPVNKSRLSYVQELVDENSYDKVTVIEGSNSRHRSIYKGVLEIQRVCPEPDVVIIQDVVRIFAEEGTIREVSEAAKTYGAAGVTRPLVSTVISTDCNGFLQESLDRSQYCASEMPQGFVFNVILTAYQKSTEEDFDHGTECLLLAMKYTGTRAKLIQGPSNLWKVTYKKDLYAAEGILKESQVIVTINALKKSLRDLITTACWKRRLKVLQEDNKRETEMPNSFVCGSRLCDWNDRNPELACAIPKLCVPNKLSMIPPVLILVALVGGLEPEDEVNFRTWCRDVGQEQGIVYGIILQDKGCYQKEAADLIASLLWNRDVTLSGQVFQIPL